jgi:hypothetical protein
MKFIKNQVKIRKKNDQRKVNAIHLQALEDVTNSIELYAHYTKNHKKKRLSIEKKHKMKKKERI